MPDTKRPTRLGVNWLLPLALFAAVLAAVEAKAENVVVQAANTISTPALASNLVVTTTGQASLKSFNVSADSTLSGAAWWVMIFNATVAPADGAVAPVKCYAAPSGTTSISGAFEAPPWFSNGIVIVVSTTGCFSKTASAHAFISGDY